MFGKHKLDRPLDGEDHVIGAPTAAVQLVAYVDYECPYSAEFFSTIEAIRLHMSSQVRIALRPFPLAKHPHAELAAEAALAAGAQSRFWEMSALLFENQRDLELRALFRYAHELRLDVRQFERDLEAGRFHHRVRELRQSGEKSGVKQTPSLFINGVLHEGKRDLRTVVNALEDAAKKADHSYASLDEHPFIGA